MLLCLLIPGWTYQWSQLNLANVFTITYFAGSAIIEDLYKFWYYKYDEEDERKTWVDAEDLCERDGGHLAYIKDEEEYKYIKDTFIGIL